MKILVLKQAALFLNGMFQQIENGVFGSIGQ